MRILCCLLVLTVASACRQKFPSEPSTPVDGGLGAPGDYTRAMADFSNREYDVHVPTGYDGVTPLPVVMVLHGGGGDKEGARKMTCPGGDESSAECMGAVADERGFIVVYPNGTGAALLSGVRTWNAGGGSDGWQCVSGGACKDGIDEKAYFTSLLADLAKLVRFNAQRVFATGHSNGAAMSHRLACELPEAIAGIAPNAAGNQYATTKPCSAPTPVLEVHGTADSCWAYGGGSMACGPDNNPGSKVSVAASVDGWRVRNGCEATPTITTLEDTTSDGTTTRRHVYSCPAGQEVIHYEVVGGGHGWPNGDIAGANGGTISTDFSMNRHILDFFTAH